MVASQVRNFVDAAQRRRRRFRPNASHGRGSAIFQLSPDGTELSYRLIASNIHNVHMAHIHIAGSSGRQHRDRGLAVPVDRRSGRGPLGSGRHDGVLATGTITAANFVGALAGHPMSDLVAAIDAGQAYVNVHTNDGMGALNTGIGDLQGGEIRGQLP